MNVLTPLRALSTALVLAGGVSFAMADESARSGVRRSVQPVFPHQLHGTAHTDGYAIVALTVADDGHVADFVALEASHVAFATSAEAAARQWEFEPRESGTRPPRQVLQFEFRSAGVISSLTHAEAAERSLDAGPLRPKLRTVEWSELDRPPVALSTVSPRVRGSALERLEREPLIVSFVIDTEGAVRVPTVPAGADDEVATSVLAAVRQWRYAPPSLGGEPVLVQATRAFGGGEKK